MEKTVSIISELAKNNVDITRFAISTLYEELRSRIYNRLLEMGENEVCFCFLPFGHKNMYHFDKKIVHRSLW